jgi:AraC-like DNA-binding protein
MLILFLLHSQIYFLSLAEALGYLERIYFQSSPAAYFSIFLNLTQTFLYLLFCLRLLYRHEKRMKQSFSALEKVNLSWIRHLVIMFVFIWVVAVAIQGFLPDAMIQAKLDDGITYFLITLIIFSIGYRGLSQPEIFLEVTEPPSNQEKIKKYEKTGLSREKGFDLKEKLLDTMTNKKLYLDHELTLAQVAGYLDVPVHQLSQVINEKMKRNFFQFINTYRVEEAKALLVAQKSREDKLIKIAFDSGFNSLSTFNRVFKDITGLSPSQFRKQH